MSLIRKKSQTLHSVRPTVSYVSEEVITLKSEWIEAAQKPNRLSLRLVS